MMENCTGYTGDALRAYCGEGGLCGTDGKCWCAQKYWHNPTGREALAGWCVLKPTSMSHISSFCAACLLLVIGKWTRIYVKPLQKLYLPSSVIGGAYGLIFCSLAKLEGHFDNYVVREWISGWAEQPAFLINIAFASLFLGVEIPPIKKVWQAAGPQLMYGMVVSWGQYVAAILITAVLLVPAFGANPLIALIVPIGFAGGAGTAAGLAPAFKHLGFDDGGDVALASATVGLLASVLVGMALVNIAARKGWVKESKMQTATSKLSLQGITPPDDRPVAGFQTVSADSIDALAWHLAIIGLAMLIGYAIKQALLAIEASSQALSDLKFFSGFPLFPLCMIGGIVIQRVLQRYNRRTKLVDNNLMNRLSGTALDFLVVTAMSTVNLGAVASNIWPFLILMVWGLAWQIFCALFVARFLNPTHWFENGICVMGQSTGVIAVGLILLRSADPESRTPVPAAFSYKQLIHSMFMGGGIWTSISLPLTKVVGIWGMLIITSCVTLAWVASWAFYFRPYVYPRMRKEWKQKEAQMAVTAGIQEGEGEQLLYEPPEGGKA